MCVACVQVYVVCDLCVMCARCVLCVVCVVCMYHVCGMHVYTLWCTHVHVCAHACEETFSTQSSGIGTDQRQHVASQFNARQEMHLQINLFINKPFTKGSNTQNTSCLGMYTGRNLQGKPRLSGPRCVPYSFTWYLLRNSDCRSPSGCACATGNMVKNNRDKDDLQWVCSLMGKKSHDMQPGKCLDRRTGSPLLPLSLLFDTPSCFALQLVARFPLLPKTSRLKSGPVLGCHEEHQERKAMLGSLCEQSLSTWTQPGNWASCVPLQRRKHKRYTTNFYQEIIWQIIPLDGKISLISSICYLMADFKSC